MANPAVFTTIPASAEPNARAINCVVEINELATSRSGTAAVAIMSALGDQVPVSSHRKLLSSKAMVVSVAEQPGQDSGRQG